MAPRTRVALFAFAGALVSGDLAVRLAPTPEEASAQPIALLTSTLALHVTLALLVVGAVSLLRGRDPRDRFGLRAGALGLGGTLWAMAGTVAVSHAVHRVLSLLALRGEGTLGSVDRAVAAAAERPGTLLLATLALAVVPPLTEELLFRGLVLRTLTRRLRPWLAIGLSAGLFGAFHVDPIHAAAATVLGLYLGVVAWRADSVRPAIASHLANNGLGVATAAIAGGAAVSGAPSGGAATETSYALIAGLLLFAGYALRRVWRATPPPPGPGPAPGEGPAHAGSRGPEETPERPTPDDEARSADGGRDPGPADRQGGAAPGR